MTDDADDLRNKLDRANRSVDALVKCAGVHRDAAFLYNRRIEKLDAAIERAVEIIDAHLYSQREKVKDASAILRDALSYDDFWLDSDDETCSAETAKTPSTRAKIAD